MMYVDGIAEPSTMSQKKASEELNRMEKEYRSGLSPWRTYRAL